MFRCTGGDNDDVERPTFSRPTVEVRHHARAGSTNSDASGTRLLGDGGGGGSKAREASIVARERGRSTNTGEDRDDATWSDMSAMMIHQHPKRGDGHRRGGNRGGHARTSSTGSVGGLGGVGSGGMKGQEPAVKNCGCMTTATFMKLATVLVAVINLAALWIQRYDASTGKLCSFGDPNACVTSVASKVFLSIARLSAGALFPSIACCVLSKCYATRYFLHHSWLTLIVDLEPTHKLHTYFGVVTLVCSLIHTSAHVARAFYERKPERLVGDAINLSGVAATLFLLPVAVPMMAESIKKKITFECRKLMHMLFIPFIVAICFHGSVLMAEGTILLVWYLLDRLYFTTKMTFFIDRPIFKPVGRGTLVRFELPTGYQYKPGAYVQVNCPAISASEWHPFSIFPVPGPTTRAGFHVEAVGDWTEELFRLGLEDPRMPLWITAAQPSVLEQTVYYDNGDPSVPHAPPFAKKKNVHLLWLSREAGMIALFEKQLHRVKSTVYLTGKPSAKTKKRIIDLLAPSRAEVVAKPASCSSKPNSRASSFSDLTMLEDGALGDRTASFLDYRGTFRDDDNTEGATDDGQDEASIFGESMLGGGSPRGSAFRGRYGESESKARDSFCFAKGHRGHRRRPSRGKNGRSRGLHPVSLNFGRPKIEDFIAETIQGTAVIAEWAGQDDPTPGPAAKARPTSLKEVISRLNTNQRMSKMDLMSADLSVVEPKPSKSSSVSGTTGFGAAEGGRGKKMPCPVESGTWLVLYCGGNANIEQAIASACNKLNVTWRREYFSAW
eukprot:jgi/Undpi1/2144/HiC_scaffold_12.g05530.m1